jgi:hypothetical protein
MEITIHLNIVHESTIRWIEAESLRTGLTIEQIIQQLIQSGIASEQNPLPPPRHHDLDALAGGWSATEAEEFQLNTAVFAQIDEKIW